MPDIRSTDRLIALFIAALCTGVYLCTLLLSVRWLVFRDEGWRIRQHINKGFLVATLTIAVFSTIHTVLAVTTSIANIREVESATPSTKPAEKVPWESIVMQEPLSERVRGNNNNSRLDPVHCGQRVCSDGRRFLGELLH